MIEKTEEQENLSPTEMNSEKVPLIKLEVEIPLNKPKVELTGKISEVCTIWQLRRNFMILMLLLGSNSFIYFLLNFQMKYVTGSLITNTLAS